MGLIKGKFLWWCARRYKFFRHSIIYRYFKPKWVEIPSLTSSKFYINLNSIIKRGKLIFYDIKECPENDEFYYLTSFMLDYNTCKWGVLSKEKVKEYKDGCSSHSPIEFAPKEEVMTRMSSSACDYDIKYVKELYKKRVSWINRLLLPVLMRN